MDGHNIAICNGKTFNMVQLPPNEANAIETSARLSTTDSQTNIDQPSNGQPITNSHNNCKGAIFVVDDVYFIGWVALYP